MEEQIQTQEDTLVSLKKEDETVPLARLLKERDDRKLLAEELNRLKKEMEHINFEKQAEKERKLLEEKQFQELLSIKEREVLELKSSFATEKRNSNLALLSSEAKNLLQKNNIINADDGLKFLEVDGLLESKDISKELEKRIEDLVVSKPYLFNAQRSNHPENKKPVTTGVPNPVAPRNLQDALLQLWNKP
jgi:hypothetical protein